MPDTEQTVIHCGSEKVLVTGIDGDTPTFGLDSLTVERGYAGTTAATHAADDFAALYYYEGFHNDVARRQQRLERFLIDRMGQQDGVIRGGLAVTATGSPSMTVDISAGSAVAAGQPTALVADTTLTFTAPVTNPRIDRVVINQLGEVSAVTGTESGSPSAPAEPADSETLALVTHTTAETSIQDSNDASNGYITDSRTFI
jgi:hypothetical protein